MKKILLLALGMSLALSACLPTFLQPKPSPVPEVDLAGTADVLVQETLQAQPQPSATLSPSKTPVVTTPTLTQVPYTPTETQNSFLLTLTATLGTGTAASTSGTLGTPTITATGTLPSSTPTSTSTTVVGATPTETLHPRFYGTLPPSLPFGIVTLINKSKTEAYISLQCTTSDGNVTIIEYPVGGGFDVKAPAGKYVYVAWVGGNKMIGSFGLSKGDQITIKLYKDKVIVTNK